MGIWDALLFAPRAKKAREVARSEEGGRATVRATGFGNMGCQISVRRSDMPSEAMLRKQTREASN